MTGAAGASFSDTQSATFGIEIGERINSRVQAYVAFNYFDDLFNDQAASDLNDLSNYLTSVTGEPGSFRAATAAWRSVAEPDICCRAGHPSVRMLAGGLACSTSNAPITERTLGDVSDPVLVVFGAPDGFIDAREAEHVPADGGVHRRRRDRLRPDLRGRGIPLPEGISRRVLHVLAVHRRRRHEVLDTSPLLRRRVAA